MDQSIEDCIRDCRILEIDVPLIDGQLARDQGRLAIVAVIEDLEQVTADRIGERREAEVEVRCRAD